MTRIISLRARAIIGSAAGLAILASISTVSYAQLPPTGADNFATVACDGTVTVIGTQDGDVALRPGHSLSSYVNVVAANPVVHWTCTTTAGVLHNYFTTCVAADSGTLAIVDTYFELDGRVAVSCGAGASAP